MSIIIYDQVFDCENSSDKKIENRHPRASYPPPPPTAKREGR